MGFILKANGFVPGEVWGYAGGSTGVFTFIFTKSIYFGSV
jgi:PTS system ascorbate-specific IIC component